MFLLDARGRLGRATKCCHLECWVQVYTFKTNDYNSVDNYIFYCLCLLSERMSEKSNLNIFMFIQVSEIFLCHSCNLSS